MLICRLFENDAYEKKCDDDFVELVHMLVMTQVRVRSKPLWHSPAPRPSCWHVVVPCTSTTYPVRASPLLC